MDSTTSGLTHNHFIECQSCKDLRAQLAIQTTTALNWNATIAKRDLEIRALKAQLAEAQAIEKKYCDVCADLALCEAQLAEAQTARNAAEAHVRETYLELRDVTQERDRLKALLRDVRFIWAASGMPPAMAEAIDAALSDVSDRPFGQPTD